MVDSKQLAYPLLKVAQQKFSSSPTQLTSEQREQAEQIARRKLQIEDAVLSSREAAGVTIPDDQVQGALGQMVADLGDEQALENLLLDLGLEHDELTRAIARELRVEAVLDRVSATLEPVTETDARLYYYMNPDRFVRPEIRVARHILVTINPQYPENVRAEAHRRISEICQRLQKKPDRFAEQAMKHSECPTSLQGGLMGNVMRGRLFPELEEVLFGLKVGEVSDVVESPVGFHVMLCDSIQAPGPLALEDILPRLREKLEQQQKERLQKRWISDVMQAQKAGAQSDNQTSNPEGRLANG